MDVVKLKNGAEEAKAACVVVLAILRDLSHREPIAIYELVMKARDRNHHIFGGMDGAAAKTLIGLALIDEQGQMHDTTRNIIVSAVQGNGFDMTTAWPGVEPPND